jgi:3-deoxy-D-manno-octulosonic-acid transferase
MISLIVGFLDFIQVRAPLRYLGVRKSRIEGFRNSSWKQLPKSNESVTWFHASSLGELEMLRPLIDDFLEAGIRVGVSVFSDSALPGLMEMAPRCVYAGLSPREKDWQPLFRHFRVNKLVLAKYDFWPGLIRAAANQGAPVLVINSGDRRSFRLIRFLFLFRGLPSFFLFGGDQTTKGLPGVDPRWERVARRSESPSQDPEKIQRIQRWKKEIENLPRPICLIGSAWPEDLNVIVPGLSEFKGGVLIVPHSLSPGNLELIREKSSGIPSERLRIVAEMGILVELYSFADFAFVGGGFGKGIHSTIEPAIFGIPLATGPVRVGDFTETVELQKSGQLKVVQESGQVSEWVRNLQGNTFDYGFLAEKREQYRALLEECLRIR